ncbi:hypothetical protein IE4872_PC00103 (plasmid) [Rhizobium gallicum]|uniref:HTH luxR-type domain-containing protein n=2 Tax=Rhizobium gallicum TaxID=56730 RepID=A0A0B4X927_9HYPH|nr:hypothetical protein RGR602_PB00117 [Rhizobium gallicum bv. gallicum R602sp]APO70134.1 hypothetical protein IE4872_PC00103 [Rhizobium gallicum]
MTWKLSPFERSCLWWISVGRSVAEIALLEGKGEAEIRLCLDRAVVSLGATSMEDALKKANLLRSDRLIVPR